MTTANLSDEKERFISTHEACFLLGISAATLARYVKQERLPAPMRFGRPCRWRLADIEAFAAGGTAQPAAPRE